MPLTTSNIFGIQAALAVFYLRFLTATFLLKDPNGFNAGYGIPQPAPNVDGWSSGENTFDHSSAIPQQYSHSIAGGHHRGYQQQQPQQQHPHQGGGGYRGNNPRGGNSWRGGSSYRGHNQQMGGGGHYNVGATEFVPK